MRKLLFGFYLFIISSPVLSSEIEQLKSEIEAANYCETKNDCVDLGAFCPFGCNVLVNKNEVNTIKEKIKSTKPSCITKCWPIKELICENNVCKSNKVKLTL